MSQKERGGGNIYPPFDPNWGAAIWNFSGVSWKPSSPQRAGQIHCNFVGTYIYLQTITESFRGYFYNFILYNFL